MKCERCRQWLKDYGWDVCCDACPEGVPVNKINISMVETKYFPSLGNISKARVAELDRRVPIPDKTAPAGYRIGRLMDNGKVAEKNPDHLIKD